MPARGEWDDADVDLSTASWLTSRAGAEAIAVARQLWATSPDSLAAGTRLRRELPGLDSAQVAAALSQAELRALAADRYGIAGSPLLTREGLEQATRPEIAARRGRLLAEAGMTHALDLTAGLGFDSAGFAQAGIAVTCIERSPEIATLLAANLPEATVITGDCTDPAILDPVLTSLPESTVIFVDPARRTGRRTADGSRAQSERDPERWSPPLSFVIGLAERGLRVVVKTTPGFAIESIPDRWSAEWVSSDRTVVECTLASWPLFGQRRAVGIGRQEFEISATTAMSDTSEVRHFLFEPDPAVVNADAVDALCVDGVSRVDANSHWLTSDDPITHPALRGFRVEQEASPDARALRPMLRELGIGELTVKTRGAGVDAERFRASLKLSGPNSGVLVILVREGRQEAYLVTPLPSE
ncbi:MAG: hypothetical protein RL205_1821 [Actinomycetota bacterium]